MKLKILFLAPMFALAACNPNNLLQPVVSAPTAENSVFAAKTTYLGALKLANIYRNEPACAAGVTWTLAAPCHDVATLAKIRQADASAYAALTSAQQSADANPNGVNVPGLVAAASSAVDAFAASIPH